jgi:hypothetical protein
MLRQFRSRFVACLLIVSFPLLASVSADKPGRSRPSPWTAAGGLLLNGTVVTMDPGRSVIEDGHVLVRNGRIAAVWSGDAVPEGWMLPVRPGSASTKGR